ncbi:helix-turn-helix domain-containing protein [Oceanobacillus sp. J11TS1]|uniref:helix-turn-helix domain-containing protein n=1 Tax=Oceanobacillus sp. J11TS1 TaxID=2807191 RepID=UPI001B005A2E|nr:helix-turn-helix transcriptional regulator [Oceanobacillus sp. J11TS1]GIO24764.1 hypothetical protein J11TS1_33450 [Oceanobacillus sp. J11TS1]
MDTGQRIVQLRLNKNWTQKELANFVNINVSVMNRIESGDRPIKGDELSAIATVFDVTTDYLLGRKEQQTPPKSEQKDHIIEIMKKIQKKFSDSDDLFRDLASLSHNELQDIHDYILFKKSKRKKQNRSS